MKRRKLNLNSPRNVRAALAKIANWVVNDEIDTKAANAAIYCCNVILSSLRIDEQQQQIERIEEQLTELEAGTPNTNARKA